MFRLRQSETVHDLSNTLSPYFLPAGENAATWFSLSGVQWVSLLLPVSRDQSLSRSHRFRFSSLQFVSRRTCEAGAVLGRQRDPGGSFHAHWHAEVLVDRGRRSLPAVQERLLSRCSRWKIYQVVLCFSSAYMEGLGWGADSGRDQVSGLGPAGQNVAAYEGVFSSH